MQDVYIHYIPKHLSDTISAYQNFVPYFTPLWKINASLKKKNRFNFQVLNFDTASDLWFSVQFIFSITNCIEHRHHQTYTKLHQSFSVYFDTDLTRVLLIMCTRYTKNIISITNRQLWQDLPHHRSLLERPSSL